MGTFRYSRAHLRYALWRCASLTEHGKRQNAAVLAEDSPPKIALKHMTQKLEWFAILQNRNSDVARLWRVVQSQKLITSNKKRAYTTLRSQRKRVEAPAR